MIDTCNWKNIYLECGKSLLKIKVPRYCDILKTKYVPALKDPRQEIENALSNPIGSRSLEDIVTSYPKDPLRITVAIAVSDNTRPVPYSGEREEGILLPLLRRLEKIGVKRKNIKIIVATGTHLPTSDEWKEEAFGESIRNNYDIVDHECTSPDLCYLDSINGVPAKINRQFLEADIRITTGLVEPHFMAGVSGGRKTICPGLVNMEMTCVFHSAEFMDNPNATNMVLNGNPCHNFALRLASEVKVDFSINVVLNGEKELTGFFAGDLEKTHLEAVKKTRECCLISVDHEYDIVLTHGGSVAVNHYQAAKAAYGMMPIIKRGGTVILVANNSNEEPIGKDGYKKVLKVLKEKQPGRFTEFIKSNNWQFVPDQWQVQKWDQFFKKVGTFDNLIYCTTNIDPEELKKLPGKSSYDFVRGKNVKLDEMVQNAIFYAITEIKRKLNRKPQMAFVKEGPYAVPVIGRDSGFP